MQLSCYKFYALIMGHIYKVNEHLEQTTTTHQNEWIRKEWKNIYGVKRLVSSIYDWTQPNSETFKWKEIFSTPFKIHSRLTELVYPREEKGTVPLSSLA